MPADPCKDLEELHENFEVRAELGRGSFSVCHSARWHDEGEKSVAVKTIFRSKSKNKLDSAEVRNEIRLMNMIEHPNCIKLLKTYQDDKAIYLVEEIASGGDLFDRIFKDRLTLEESRTITLQIVDAVSYLHSLGICHRDLKPENILMVSNVKGSADYNTIKVSDFGLSTDGADNYRATMTNICGTPDFCAPEMLSSKVYSCKVDVWSLGVIVYTMLGRRVPFSFSKENREIMLNRVLEGKVSFSFSAFQKMDINAIAFIKALLRVNPDDRPKAKDCLSLPWLSQERIPVADSIEGQVSARASSYDPGFASTFDESSGGSLVKGSDAPLLSWPKRSRESNPVPKVHCDSDLPQPPAGPLSSASNASSSTQLSASRTSLRSSRSSTKSS